MTGNNHGGWVRRALQRHEAPLLRYASSLVGPTLAADVVQDTFLRLCRQDTDEVQGHVAAWLFTVCRNRAFEMKRQQHRDVEPLEDITLTVPSTQQHSLENGQMLGHALDELAELPPKKREVIVLKFASELSYREIAEVTGLSVSHVGVILHEALAHVRKRLRQKGLLDAEPASQEPNTKQGQLRRAQ